MIREAIDRVLELARDEQLNIDPERVDKEVVLIDKGYVQLTPPVVQSLTLATLDSLIGFVHNTELPEGCFVKVDLNGTVTLCGQPHPLTKDREQWASVGLPKVGNLTQCGGSGSPPWHPPEALIPRLLTQFEETEDRVELLRVLGNVRDGASKTYDDDGVTQTVTTRKGLSMHEMTELPSPLTLLPRATYPELENQEQLYVFRAEGGSDTRTPEFQLSRVVDPEFEYNRYNSIIAYLDLNLEMPVI